MVMGIEHGWGDAVATLPGCLVVLTNLSFRALPVDGGSGRADAEHSCQVSIGPGILPNSQQIDAVVLEATD